MTELLFFIIGLLLGGAVCCVFMAGFRLHRVNKYEYQIMKLKTRLNEEYTEIEEIYDD